MTEGAEFLEAARRLRAEFDGGFARPRGGERTDTEDLLAIRVADGRFALRLRDFDAVARCPGWTPIPARAPGLLGLAAVETALVPVFSLAEFLGLRREGAPHRWLVICRGPETLGFAWDELDGIRRVGREDCLPAPGSGEHAFVREVARLDGAPRAVVELKAVVAAVVGRRATG